MESTGIVLKKIDKFTVGDVKQKSINNLVLYKFLI